MQTDSSSELVPFRLSIVVPIYNENGTLLRVLDSLLSLDMPGKEHEVIVVNDGSTDGSGHLVDSLDDSRLVRIHHAANLGKGAAVRTGIAVARGSHVLIFDAADSTATFQIPVTAQDEPGFMVTAGFVRNGNFYSGKSISRSRPSSIS